MFNLLKPQTAKSGDKKRPRLTAETWHALVWIGLSAVGTFLLQSSAVASQPQLSETFDQLVALVAAGNWGGAEWAQASYLSLNLSSYGSTGVPYIRRRFASAKTAEEAFLAGLYTAVFGNNADLRFVRSDLETNARKRQWLRDIAGDRHAINASLANSAAWTPAVRLVPALDGCRTLCVLCMQSSDPLVRRSGLLWGFWIGGTAYWQAVGQCAAKDADPLTAQLAQHLLRQRQAQARR